MWNSNPRRRTHDATPWHGAMLAAGDGRSHAARPRLYGQGVAIATSTAYGLQARRAPSSRRSATPRHGRQATLLARRDGLEGSSLQIRFR